MDKIEPFCKDTTSIVSMIIEKCSRHFKRRVGKDFSKM